MTRTDVPESARVLVTGSDGKIGSVVARTLLAAGFEVVPFDAALGDDVRDADALRAKGRGCDAVVHLAAIAGDSEAPEDVMHTNVLGTWNVLVAARETGMRRVVSFSSVNALGVFLGHRPPDYLPIDSHHPSYARKPYSLSKRLGEEMCRAFTEETGTPTVCLRPPAVLAPEDYERRRSRWQASAQAEWTPFWEYGAFLDVRDTAEAAHRALTCPDPGHVALLLSADDIAATAPGRELAARLLPEVEWRGGEEYDRDPYRSLVDASDAKRVLGWQPRYRWRE